MSLLACLMMMFPGCDIVEPPYLEEPVRSGQDEPLLRKRVLLEKFTGHQCQFCPEGAETASRLEEIFGDQLIVVSIHAGFFANATPSAPFNAEYRTLDGNRVHDRFQVSFFPSGMVNRTPVNGTAILGHAAWGDAIGRQLADSVPLFQISINSDVDPSSGALIINTSVKALSQTSKTYKLSLLLLEDSIVSPQRTNKPSYPSGLIENYTHRHVLRAALNGTWGEPLNTSALEKDQVVALETPYQMNKNWNARQCYIVAFVADEAGMEVIQAEKKPLVQAK